MLTLVLVFLLLQAYGITGSLLSWLGSYLVDRSFFIVVNDFHSNPRYTSSGVPQGSHLGPVIFSYSINDIPNCFYSSSSFMYADDLIFEIIVKSTLCFTFVAARTHSNLLTPTSLKCEGLYGAFRNFKNTKKRVSGLFLTNKKFVHIFFKSSHKSLKEAVKFYT